MPKTCSRCGDSEPRAEFPKWRRQCVACRREITREKLKKLRASNPAHFREYVQGRQNDRRALLNQLKSVPCMDCHGTFEPCCMDFDHVRGKKQINIADMAGCYSTTSLQAELTKCDLVCACCHRIRTYDRRRSSKVSVRRQWLNTLKAKPCVDCGREFPPCAMDFDHVRGTKVSGLAKMWGRSRDDILREVSKCDLVCACCHRLRTQHRKGVAS